MNTFRPSILSRTLRFLVSTSLVIIAYLSLPLSPLLIPVYLLRFLVLFLARRFRPDLSHMLSPRGNLFAVELSEMFESRSRCTIYVSHVVDGHIPIERMRSDVLEGVVNRVDSSGALVNPELQQHLVSWLGYLFWRWDRNFKIENHVNVYTGPGKTKHVTDHDIAGEIGKELTCRPFKPNQSPWEFWLVQDARFRNDGRTKTIILLRVHHSLADGYAVLKLLLEDFAGGKIKTEVQQPTKRQSTTTTIFRKLLKVLKTVLLGPYQLITLSINSWDFNEWHISESKLTGRLNTAITEQINIEDIKLIRKVYQTSFNAVIQAAFTGGLRNFLLQRGNKIPSAFHCMTPLNMPNHPTKLRNHMTAFIAPLPVGIDDPLLRLDFIDTALQRLHASTVSTATFYMLPLIGSLPAWVIRILARNDITTCLMTNFPAPLGQVKCCGLPCEDIVFGGGLLVGNIGIGFNSLSYNGYIRLGAGIDEGLIKDSEAAKTLITLVRQELQLFVNKCKLEQEFNETGVVQTSSKSAYQAVDCDILDV